MSKYDPLTRHLRSRGLNSVPMSFGEIEKLLGFDLPPSSRRHRAWWSNNGSNSVMTKAWLAAGYQSRDVDLERERLVFQKLNATRERSESSPRRHPLLGLLAGSVRVAKGVDLTGPTGAKWAAELE